MNETRGAKWIPKLPLLVLHTLRLAQSADDVGEIDFPPELRVLAAFAGVTTGQCSGDERGPDLERVG